MKYKIVLILLLSLMWMSANHLGYAQKAGTKSYLDVIIAKGAGDALMTNLNKAIDSISDMNKTSIMQKILASNNSAFIEVFKKYLTYGTVLTVYPRLKTDEYTWAIRSICAIGLAKSQNVELGPLLLAALKENPMTSLNEPLFMQLAK